MQVNDGPGRERLPRIRILGMVAAVALVGSVGGFGAGPAAADSAPLMLRYTCSFPLIGSQPMTASIVWNASDTHVVGQATPRLPVNASATIGLTVRQGLNLVGATSVEGTADATAVVVAPQGDISVTEPLNVPVTGVPTSGSLTVRASGTMPSLVFSRPGNAKITVGGLTLHFTPRDGSGGTTVVGEVNAPCTLNPGQNDVLASFQILPAVGGPTASGMPGTPKAGTVGPSASASARATVRADLVSPDPGASDTASGTATATDAGDPSIASSATGATSGSDFASFLVAVGALAIGAAFGCVWWLRRRRADGLR